MIPVKLLFFLAILMPFLFVVGTIASSADALGPFSVGASQSALYNIVECGKGLKVFTEEFTMNEITVLRHILKGLKVPDILQDKEGLQRISMLAQRSV